MYIPYNLNLLSFLFSYSLIYYLLNNNVAYYLMVCQILLLNYHTHFLTNNINHLVILLELLLQFDYLLNIVLSFFHCDYKYLNHNFQYYLICLSPITHYLMYFFQNLIFVFCFFHLFLYSILNLLTNH